MSILASSVKLFIPSSYFDALLLIGTILASIYVFRSGNRRKQLPLPPGLLGIPIIGNALQIPKDRQWLAWDIWRRKYGKE
jgi:hypothetical protein